MAAPLPHALVDRRSHLAASEFLHTVAQSFVVHILLLQRGILLLQLFLFYFSFPAQEVLPLTNLPSPE
jgi:hypothetical protein